MGRRAYPGDPGESDNSTRAWQDVLRRRGHFVGGATGLYDQTTKDGLAALREELGSSARAKWPTVWAHAHNLKAADVVVSDNEGGPEGSGEPGGAPPA